MSYPVKELHVTPEKFFGPYMEDTLRKLSHPIADKLIREFRTELIKAVEEQVRNMIFKTEQGDKQLKIIIEDRGK